MFRKYLYLYPGRLIFHLHHRNGFSTFTMNDGLIGPPPRVRRTMVHNDGSILVTQTVSHVLIHYFSSIHASIHLFMWIAQCRFQLPMYFAFDMIGPIGCVHSGKYIIFCSQSCLQKCCDALTSDYIYQRCLFAYNLIHVHISIFLHKNTICIHTHVYGHWRPRFSFCPVSSHSGRKWRSQKGPMVLGTGASVTGRRT